MIFGGFLKVFLFLSVGHSLLRYREGEEGDGGVENAFRCDSDFERHGGAVVYILGVVFACVGLAVLCEADYKHSLMVITEKMKLSEDVAGATLMAMGSSSTELFLSLLSLAEGQATDDTGAGTIIGTAIINICLTIGLAAMFAPSDGNHVDWRPIVRDVLFNVISFAWALGCVLDGAIQWYEALVGVLLYVGYVVLMYFNTTAMAWLDRRVASCGRGRGAEDVTHIAEDVNSFAEEMSQQHQDREGEALEMEEFNEDTAEREEEADNALQEVQEVDAPMMPGEHSFVLWKRVCGVPLYRLKEGVWYAPTSTVDWIVAIGGFPFRFLFHYTIPNAENPSAPRLSCWLTFVISLVYLGIFSLILIVCSQKLGCLLGMDEAMVGVTFLALSSGLPDAMTIIFISRAGKGNMAVAGVLGANTFDVLIALGLPWLLFNLINGPVMVGSSGALIYTGILGFAIIVLMGALLWRRWRIDKLVGISLFTVYAFSLIFTILHTTGIIRY